MSFPPPSRGGLYIIGERIIMIYAVSYMLSLVQSGLYNNNGKNKKIQA